MGETLHIDDGSRKGEIKKGDQLIGRFDATDSYLSESELQTIRSALKEDRDAVIKAAQESRLGLKSMVFRDLRKASENYIRQNRKSMSEVQKKIEQATGISTGELGYGPRLFAATVDFQEKNNIHVDGVIGPETLEALFSTKTQTETKEGDRSTTYTPPTRTTDPEVVNTPQTQERREDGMTTKAYESIPTTLASGLKIVDENHPLLTETDIVKMVHLYEGSGGGRSGGDLGGGIDKGSARNELMFALGEKFGEWMRSSIPEDQVEPAIKRMLQSRIVTAHETCDAQGVDFDRLPRFAQVVITDMHYNLKPTSVKNFRKFWAAVRQENWKEAARQMIDHGNGGPSGYLGDTYVRAHANARILLSGDHTKYEQYRQEASKIIQGKKNHDERVQLLYRDIIARIDDSSPTDRTSRTASRGGDDKNGGVVGGIFRGFQRMIGKRTKEPTVVAGGLQPSVEKLQEHEPIIKHISLNEARELVAQSTPATHNEDGRLIIYQIQLKDSEKTDRYLENTDPAHQGEIETRNLGPEGKEYIAIHKTAAGWGGNPDSLSDAQVDRQGLDVMISSGLFPYLVTQKGVVIQGASDMTTGSVVGTRLANPNMQRLGGYRNFNNRGIGIEFSARGYKGRPGKYARTESINPAQQRSGRDFLAYLQEKHNITSTQVITSADPVRISADRFVPDPEVHGDDFDDTEARSLGMASQNDRLALLHSGRFFDENESNPQNLTPKGSGPEQMMTKGSIEIDTNIPDKLASSLRSFFEQELDGRGQLRSYTDSANGGRPVITYTPPSLDTSNPDIVFHLHGRSGHSFGGNDSTDADIWLRDALMAAQNNNAMLIYPISYGKRGENSGYDEQWFKTGNEKADGVLEVAMRKSGVNPDTAHIVAQCHSAGGKVMPAVIESIEPEHVVMLDATYGSWGDNALAAMNKLDHEAHLTVVLGGDAGSTGEGARRLSSRPNVTYIDAHQVAHGRMNEAYFMGQSQEEQKEATESTDEMQVAQFFSENMRLMDSDGGTAKIKQKLDALSDEQVSSYGSYLLTLFSDTRIPENGKEACAFQQYCYLAGANIRYIDGDVGDETKSFYYVAILETQVLDQLPMLTGEYDEEKGKQHSDTLKKKLATLSQVEKDALIFVRSKLLLILREDMPQEDMQLFQAGEFLAGNTNICVDGYWGPEMESLIHVPEKTSLEYQLAYERLSRHFQIYSTSMGYSENGSDRAKNRTSLVGLRGYSLNGAIELAQAVGAKPGELVITGGTEKGHSGSGEGTHLGGSKLDFRVDDKLVAFTGLTGMGQKATKYINGRQVDFYRHGPDDHFDVRFHPRIDASVQGDYMMAQSRTTNERYVESASEYIAANNVPQKWHSVVTDFFRRLPENEKITTSTPIAVASKRSKRGIFINDGGSFEYPVILGSGGTLPGEARSGSRKTPTDLPVRFSHAKIAKTFDGDASNTGSRTVKGASLQGPQLAAAGGMWWHGVADYRIKSGATWGCVGMPIADARKAAAIINEKGGGWGFVSEGISI